MSAKSPFLRARDLAPLLGVSARRVRQIIRAGRIPSVREGRSVLVPRLAWETWLRRRSVEALAGLELTPGPREQVPTK